MVKGKVWYKSKTVWAAICVPVLVIAQPIALGYGITLPMNTIYSILGAFGVYGIRDSISTITGKNRKNK